MQDLAGERYSGFPICHMARCRPSHVEQTSLQPECMAIALGTPLRCSVKDPLEQPYSVKRRQKANGLTLRFWSLGILDCCVRRVSGRNEETEKRPDHWYLGAGSSRREDLAFM